MPGIDHDETRFDPLVDRILTKLAASPGQPTQHGPPQSALYEAVSKKDSLYEID